MVTTWRQVPDMPFHSPLSSILWLHMFFAPSTCARLPKINEPRTRELVKKGMKRLTQILWDLWSLSWPHPLDSCLLSGSRPSSSTPELRKEQAGTKEPHFVTDLLKDLTHPKATWFAWSTALFILRYPPQFQSVLLIDLENYVLNY